MKYILLPFIFIASLIIYNEGSLASHEPEEPLDSYAESVGISCYEDYGDNFAHCEHQSSKFIDQYGNESVNRYDISQFYPASASSIGLIFHHAGGSTCPNVHGCFDRRSSGVALKKGVPITHVFGIKSEGDVNQSNDVIQLSFIILPNLTLQFIPHHDNPAYVFNNYYNNWHNNNYNNGYNNGYMTPWEVISNGWNNNYNNGYNNNYNNGYNNGYIEPWE